MPATFSSLPIELQRQILAHLYKPWHIKTEKVGAVSAYPVYKLVASTKLETAPLLVSKTLREVSGDLLLNTFTNVLDSTDSEDNSSYSILPRFPRYKTFLPKVTKLIMRGLAALARMGPTYKQHLPSLNTIEVLADNNILYIEPEFRSSDASALLNAIVNTDVHHETMITDILKLREYWYKYSDTIWSNFGIKVLLHQTFEFASLENVVIVVVDLSTDPVMILKKTVGGSKFQSRARLELDLLSPGGHVVSGYNVLPPVSAP